MAKPKAVYVKDVGRLPIDSELTVVMRAKASFKEALGWSYRFRSGEEWVLVPLEEASVFVYDEPPKASTIGDEQRSAPRHAARYIDELL